MKGNKIKDGFMLLLYSLFPIIIGPVIIQIGNTKYQTDLNIYTFIGVFICIITYNSKCYNTKYTNNC